MDDIQKNLDKIDCEFDLFGNKIEKLSMLDRLGFIPLSILEPDWEKTKKLKAIIGDKGQTRELVKGNTTFGADVGAPIFNPDLAHKILSAYCPQGARILDQFGGGGTRGLIAAAMGFDYFGIELRQEEVDRIRQQAIELDKKFTIVQGDSTQFQLPLCEFGFSYTCPPYYDLEVYSNKEEDLSNLGTYDEFMVKMEEVLRLNYKALKPNALSVWVVGNFRDKKGNLIHYSGDLIARAKKAGFVLHDELIWWGASKCASQRSGQFEANRKSVRVHEYIIILKKPE